MNGLVLKIGRAVNAMCRKSHWYNEILFPDCAKFWNHRLFNLDVVNLGSTSSVHAFSYDGIPLKCANWALGHNPLSGDEAILKNYMSFLNPAGSTVIFSLCPFSSLAGSYSIMDDRYYTLLYASSIPSFSKQRQAKVLHMKDRPIKYYPIYYFFYDMVKGILAMFHRKGKKPFTDIQMKNDAEHWMESWKREFSLKAFDAPLSLINCDAIDDALKIIERLVSFCKQRNIRPVFIIPPVYHTLGDLFSMQAKEQIIGRIASKLEDNGVSFINYMEEPDFSFSTDLFENSFYLNEKGAKAFTKKVLSDIGLI